MQSTQRFQSINFSRKLYVSEKTKKSTRIKSSAMKCNVQNLNLLYTHDANKNVTEVFFKNPDNGLAAHYEYSPFGELRDFSHLSSTPETSNSETNAIVETLNYGHLASSQSLSPETNAIVETLNSANASPGDLIGWRNTPITEIDIRTFNPFRFSSEYHDDELSLIYYNYRHYDPATGRFLSRDPIAEQGGTNLYNFLENDGINRYDIWGLFGDGRRKNGKPVERKTRKIVSKRSFSFNLRFTLGQRNTIIPYITPATIIDIDEYDEEIDVDNGPSGHSDFYGYDKEFDWTWEDSQLTTSPYTPWGLGNHFQDYSQSKKQVDAAIKNCNISGFNSAMHRLQDFFSHYNQGYRAIGGRGIIGHFTHGSEPDDNENAWIMANIFTEISKSEWDRKCCKNKNKQWVKRN